jgi:diguanylate cyclase (GGDEF)-like protein
MGDERLLNVCSPAIKRRGYELVRAGIADVAVGFSLSPDDLAQFRRTAQGRNLPLILVKEGENWPQGADMVLRWPVSPEFVAAGIEAAHARTLLDRSFSTLTGLPGGRAAAAEMAVRFEQGCSFYATYIDVNDFKPYNDAYGFDRGDRIIQALSVRILESTARLDDADAFCGHIGGDDFLVVTRDEPSSAMKWLASEFDQMIRGFYSETDISRRGIVSLDRDGRRKRFPLMSVSIVTLRCGEAGSTISELSGNLAGIKRRAKAGAALAEGSVYIYWPNGGPPGDSGSLLAELIDDDSAPLVYRRAALEAAGVLRVGEVVESLHSVLEHSSQERLRKSAAYSLGRIGDKASVEKLAAALEDGSAHVRMRAAEALGEIGDSGALEPLLNVTSDPNQHVRSAAVSALGHLGVQAALRHLANSLNDCSLKVRLSAVRAVGLLGGRAAYGPLAMCLERKGKALRRVAAEAMGRVSDERCAEALVKILDDRDTGIVWRAAYSLYLLSRNGSISVPHADAAARLTGLLSSTDPYLLRSAALALGALAVPGTSDRIIPLLLDKRDFVRAAAAWALGSVGDRCAIGPLRGALKDGRSAVREKAAWALGEVGKEDSLEPLRIALKDRAEAVREMAALSICRILEKLCQDIRLPDQD